MAEAHARRTDPETSHEAAEKVSPHIETQRAKVLRFAAGKNKGFIDEELQQHYRDDTKSSLRTRRNELWQENWILDTGERRENSDGSPCIVWIHRQFVMDAPPLKSRDKAAEPSLLKKHALEELIPKLEQEERSLRGTGHGQFANLIGDTIATLRGLANG